MPAAYEQAISFPPKYDSKGKCYPFCYLAGVGRHLRHILDGLLWGERGKHGLTATQTLEAPVLCLSAFIQSDNELSGHGCRRSAMLQELSNMDRITQLQDEIQQVRLISLILHTFSGEVHNLDADHGDHVQHYCIPHDTYKLSASQPGDSCD